MRPWWFLAGVALLPLLAVALGGGTERWSQAIVLLGLGALLLARPPRESLGRGLNAAFLGFILLAGTAFLPARWFAWPTWRAALTDDLGAALPATLSVQPWISLEGLALLLAGLGWVYLQATVRWTPEERARVGGWFAGGVVILAAGFLLLFRAGLAVPGWHSARGFGPFPNRNQTADFLAVGALPVLACARAAWRAQARGAALLWLLGWLTVAGAVFACFSRGGVVLLFAGTLLFLGAEFLRSRRQARGGGAAAGAKAAVAGWRKAALAASLGLALLGGFLFFGGDTLNRFRAGGGMAESNAASDALRGRIQADAARMVLAQPWAGAGLGDFDEVFAAGFRRQSASPLRVLHPENDWLWLGSELGWPAILLAVAAVVWLARRLRLPRHGPERPLRVAAAVGLALFAAHGFVEVSAHRLGSAFAALFLLGLAMPGPEGGRTGAATERWVGTVFRTLGAVFVAVGLLWLAEAGGWLLPGAQGVARLRAEALSEGEALDARGSRYDWAQQTASRALAWAPLDWRLYYIRGAAGVGFGRDLYGTQADPRRARLLDGTLADFRRARFLEKCAAGVPLGEAQLWASVGQSPQAVSALLEACRRDPYHAPPFLRNTLAIGNRWPDFFGTLSAAVRRDPALLVALLEQVGRPESTRLIEAALAADPDLRRLDDRQKRRFFRAWQERGEGVGLPAAMAAHPAWQPLGWRAWAGARARGGDAGALREACEIAGRFAPPPAVPPATGAGKERTVEELSAEAFRAPGDPAAALALYRAQTTAGDAPGALATLRRTTARADCPAYFSGLEARFAATLGDWETSWGAWQRELAEEKL